MKNVNTDPSGNLFSGNKLSFQTLLKGLEAFVAHLDMKVAEIHNNIPIYFLNTGDETYYQPDINQEFNGLKKVQKIDRVYNTNPRMIIKLDTVENDMDAKTSKTTIKYLFDNKLYQGQFNNTKLDIPIVVNMITPNFIFGLEYFEMLLTIFNDTKVFTYNHMGNDYQGGYKAISYNFEFPPIEAGSTNKAFIINFTINLQLPIYIVNLSTIKELNDDGELKNNKPQFNIGINKQTTKKYNGKLKGECLTRDEDNNVNDLGNNEPKELCYYEPPHWLIFDN